MTVPFNFATQSGNIPLSELDANFANVSARTLTATYVTGNNQSNITDVGLLNSLFVYGNVTSGNVSANGNIRSNIITGVNYTGGNVSVTGKVTSASITASGNIVGGNVNANALNVTSNAVISNLTVTGTFVGGDIVVNGIVNGTSNVDITNANGNITLGVNGVNNVLVVTSTGANVIGNTSVGNLKTVGTISAAGNVIGGNLEAVNLKINNISSDDSTIVIIQDGLDVYGDTVVNGNISAVGTVQAGGNVRVNGQISITGTVFSGAGFFTSNEISVGGNATANNILTAGQVSATGNVTGGNLITVGQVNNSGLEVVGVNYANITANAATSNLSATISTNILIANNTGYTHTINMPTTPVDGQVTRFTISGNTVTLVEGTGTVTPGFAGSTTAGTGYKYVYRNTNTTWYRSI
jgi:hypothetical protein